MLRSTSPHPDIFESLGVIAEIVFLGLTATAFSRRTALEAVNRISSKEAA